MSKIKEYYFDYLSAEEYDLMTDEEYDQWLELQQQKINELKTLDNVRN